MAFSFYTFGMEQKSNREHSFDIELATILSPFKAIILKNVSYWCEENKRRRLVSYQVGSVYWTAESLASLQKKYPYMTKPSISRWVAELEKDQWLRVIRKEREVSFYRPGLVYDLWNNGEDWQAELERLSQNETPEPCLKMRHPLSQNETPLSQNETPSCLKMRHTNIDNIEGDIEGNIESDLKAKKGKKTDYEPRDVAAFLEIPVQVFYTEILQNGCWAEWLEYKKKEHRFTYKTPQSHAKAINDFYTQIGGRSELTKKAIDFVISKTWKGIFLPKNFGQNGNDQQKSNYADNQHELASFVLNRANQG